MKGARRSYSTLLVRHLRSAEIGWSRTRCPSGATLEARDTRFSSCQDSRTGGAGWGVHPGPEAARHSTFDGAAFPDTPGGDRRACPELNSLPSTGTDYSATLLVVARTNSEKLGSENSFDIFAASRLQKSAPARSCVTASTLCRQPRLRSCPVPCLRRAHAGR